MAADCALTPTTNRLGSGDSPREKGVLSCHPELHILKMISPPNKSPATLDPHYIRVENFELDTVDLTNAGSNTPAESLWEILDYDPGRYKMGEWEEKSTFSMEWLEIASFNLFQDWTF